MKRLFLPIALAIATAMPLCAIAQQAPPDGPAQGGPPPMARPSMSPQKMQQMRAMRDHMRELQQQNRDRMLGGLTPAHRELLASIAGHLAVAEHPDYRAAVNQLDAALSNSEKSAILADAKQMRAQMKQMMGSMPHRTRGWKGHKRREHHRQITAGAILLMTAAHGGGPAMPMRGGWHR